MHLSIEKKIVKAILAVLVICLYSCASKTQPASIVYPENFKTQIPFINTPNGIVINSFWGRDKISNKVCLDNHSPNWLNNKLLIYNKSLSELKGFAYRTATADGTSIEGDVYVCDSISVGSVTFKNIPFYKISGKVNENQNGNIDGVLGEDIMSKGVWKIDFKNSVITFASSIDSIEKSVQQIIFPTNFTNDGIAIPIAFRDTIKRIFFLDLGFNRMILLPLKDFLPIGIPDNHTYFDSARFSTPAGSGEMRNVEALDVIKIGERYYRVDISSNELAKERLIGRAFFAQFEYIILDYLHKTVYVSTRMVNE